MKHTTSGDNENKYNSGKTPLFYRVVFNSRVQYKRVCCDWVHTNKHRDQIRTQGTSMDSRRLTQCATHIFHQQGVSVSITHRPWALVFMLGFDVDAIHSCRAPFLAE